MMSIMPKKTKVIRTNSAKARSNMVTIAKHLLAVAAVLLGVFLALSLLSYDPNDPSINVASNAVTKNWMGGVGAMVADPLVQLLFVTCFFCVVCPIIWGIKWLKYKHMPYLWLRILCFALLIPLCSAWVTSFDTLVTLSPHLPVKSLGGAIGGFTYPLFTSLMPENIFWIICTLLVVICAYIALGLNIQEWRSIVRHIGHIIARAAAFIHRSVMWIWVHLLRRDTVNTQSATTPTVTRVKKETKLEKSSLVKARKSKKKAVQTTMDIVMQGDYQVPSMTLLSLPERKMNISTSETALTQNAMMLEKVLDDFGVKGEIIEVHPGPVVTLYALQPAAGTKSSRVIGLADDIARSMSAVSARIAVIPGQNAIGIELPNSNRETVFLREQLEHDVFARSKASLPLALGKDIGGEPTIVDLAKTPHLLVAGTTGSGKSVGINSMIISLLYRYGPDECKFIMIDPKMLELSVYEDIPHLLAPVVTEPKKAVVALKWVVKEMEQRYRLMSNLNVRNLSNYNEKLKDAEKKGKKLTRQVQTGYDPSTGKPLMEEVALDTTPLPYIVVIVDEMADLMLVAGKDIETYIQRLAQMARAAGIHIILATQRPSVDVITGVIKANFPSRISFQVTSKIDSRTILGEQGAEQLLGMGDMLYMAGGSKITRVHGAFVKDEEVEAVVHYVKEQGTPNYIDDITRDDEEDGGDGEDGGEKDELYDQAVAIVIRDGKASTSYVQRALKIGYNRAANIIDQMEREGVISAADHVGRREVLIN